MKSIKTVLNIALIAGCTMLWSCSDSDNKADGTAHDTDPVEAAEDKNEDQLQGQPESDAERILEIYSGSLYEVALSENAATITKNAEVKNIATMMSAAHKKMNTDLKILADSKGIALPTAITGEQSEKISKMSDNSNFDEDYLDKLIEKHRDAINKAEQLSANSNDTDVKAFFSKAVPELKSHMEMAKKLEDKIDGSE